MIPLSRRVLTPRTPGGWALFMGRIAAAVLLVLVTLGACVWAFFGQDAFMAYLAVAVFALIAAGCGTYAAVFFLAHRTKGRKGEYGMSGPVQFRRGR